MRIVFVLVLVITSPRAVAADSFMSGARTSPDLELTIRDLLRATSPLAHLGIHGVLRGSNPQFFEHHLLADPTNDLRVLDVALSHAQGHRSASPRRARTLLAALGQRTTDPEMKVVAAIGLAQSDVKLSGRAGWHSPSRDKALVVALITDACSAHVRAPIVGLGEAVAAFVAAARAYRGYTGLDDLAACGRVRAPDHPPDGLFVHDRWADGSPQFEMTWRAGKRNGPARRYHDDGVLAMENTWVDDRLEGVERRYYASGVLQLETRYRAGVQEGPARGYHPNGKKQWEGSYSAGRKVGSWQHWDRDGKLVGAP
jgi:hypothetical protein